MDASDPNGDWTMRALFEAELAPGERILWTGRPARRGLDGGTIFCIVGSLIWFPVFNWFVLEKMDMFYGFPIFGKVLWFTIMAIIVLNYIALYPAMRIWYQRHTGYALTDRRILSVVLDARFEKKRIRSEAIELVVNDGIRLFKDGSGTLEFGRNRLAVKRMWIIPEVIRRQATSPLAFVEIEDGQAVHQQFLSARDRIRGTGGQPG